MKKKYNKIKGNFSPIIAVQTKRKFLNLKLFIFKIFFIVCGIHLVMFEELLSYVSIKKRICISVFVKKLEIHLRSVFTFDNK